MPAACESDPLAVRRSGAERYIGFTADLRICLQLEGLRDLQPSEHFILIATYSSLNIA